jgi:RNA polymerase sigma-70 factor (ECF subfamily)
LDRYERLIAHTTPSKSATDKRLELVYAELRNLDEAERSLMLLHLDGFSYQEIAETLGITVTNVGARLNRTKQKLIERLKGK